MAITRRSLGVGQYSTSNAWAAFLDDVRRRSGVSYLSPQDLNSQATSLWTEQIQHARSRAARQLKISSLLENAAISDGFKKRGLDLQEEIDAYPPLVSQMKTSIPWGMSESTLAREYQDFDRLRERINELGRDMENLEKSAPLLSLSAEELANKARQQMTAEELEQIRLKAGSDELYFAQLKNQLFLTKLAAEHTKELGPEIMASINQQLAETEKFLDEAKPTIVSQVLESKALDIAIDTAKNARMQIPKIGLGIGKWALLIGGSAAVLGLGAIWLIAKTISAGIRSHKPSPGRAN